MKAQTVIASGFAIPDPYIYVAEDQVIDIENPGAAVEMDLNGESTYKTPSRLFLVNQGGAFGTATIKGVGGFNSQTAITEQIVIPSGGAVSQNFYTSVISISISNSVAATYDNGSCYWLGDPAPSVIFLDTSISNINATITLFAVDPNAEAGNYFSDNAVAIYSSLTASPALPFGGIIENPLSLSSPVFSDLMLAPVSYQPVDSNVFRSSLLSPVGALYVTAPTSETGKVYMTVLQQGSGY